MSDEWKMEDVSADPGSALGPNEFLVVAGHTEVSAGMLADGPDTPDDAMRLAVSLTLDCVDPASGKRGTLSLIYPPELLTELVEICLVHVPELLNQTNAMDDATLFDRTRRAVAKKLGADQS